MKTISQGAEAIIKLDKDKVIKSRIKKSYRIPFLDKKLRKSRTKSETKILTKLQNVIPVPRVISSNNEDELIIEHIEGKKLSENLEKLDHTSILKQLATSLTKLHNLDLIHGDLTTSNMIYKDNKVYLIDFGLGFHSRKIEDKAVDLHLLKQALEAKHHITFPDSYNTVIKNYKAKDKDLILKRIEAIEKRGRYRH